MSEEFDHVSDLLKEALPDDPNSLIQALENIEVWNARMQFLLAEANTILAQESFRALPNSGTELERKTALKCLISDAQEERDKLEAVCDSIKTRITLGQSFLKYYSTTQNIQYKDANKQSNNTQGDPF